MTVMDDDVVESVFHSCGQAGLGLYSYLERRVGANGCYTLSIADLANACQETQRYVQKTMAKLIEHKWVERIERTNRFGLAMENTWHLPHHKKKTDAANNSMTTPEHMRTDGGELTGELTGEPSGELTGEPKPGSQFTPLSSQSSQEVVGSTGDTPPLPPEPDPPKPKRRNVATELPNDFAVTDEMRSKAMQRYGMTAEQVDAKTERFKTWAVAKGQRYANWGMGWMNFMEPKAWDVSPQLTLRERLRGNGAPTASTLDRAFDNIRRKRGELPAQDGPDVLDITEFQGARP